MNLRGAILANARTIAKLSDADLKRLIPVLKEARDMTATGLRKWLTGVEREDTYTTARHRQLIRSLDESLKHMKSEFAGAMKGDLITETIDAASKAAVAMKRVATQAATPLGFDTAKIVLSSNRALMGRHEASAARYAGRQGDDIRKILAVGLVKGDSVGSVVSRLMGKPRLDTSEMGDGEAAEGAAENLFFRSRADAERLVRTENVHAANAVQSDALEDENDAAEEEGDDGEREGGWLLRWDATFDKRTCGDCEDMDGEIREPGEPFDEDVYHPPLHPNCRCAVTPWREGWSL